MMNKTVDQKYNKKIFMLVGFKTCHKWKLKSKFKDSTTQIMATNAKSDAKKMK
jgi:hypothetical protein